ncbi:MAG: SH3 domain-containing protein [Bacteroidota bacterium]
MNEAIPTTTSNASSDQTIREIPIEKALIVAAVDQLRIRREPSLDGVVLTELSEGDSLYYLNAYTVKTTALRLRDQDMNRPWLKVETNDGKIGWTYGGGVDFR